MFAQNIAHQAVIDGHTVLFTSAGQLLGDLCALDSDSTLQRRLRHYARPQLLVIDVSGGENPRLNGAYQSPRSDLEPSSARRSAGAVINRAAARPTNWR